MQENLFIIILPGTSTFFRDPRHHTRSRFPPGDYRGQPEGVPVLSLAVAGTGRVVAHCKVEEES
jgi:hypothetical protein